MRTPISTISFQPLVKHIREISLIALLIPPRLGPLLRHVLSVSLTPFLNELDADSFNSFADITTTTYKDLGALVPQLVKILTVMRHSVLNILAAEGLVGSARVGLAHLDGAKLLPSFEFFSVEIVNVREAAAVEEQCRSNLSASGNHGCALLDEAPEGREARANAN